MTDSRHEKDSSPGSEHDPAGKKRFSPLQVLGIVLLTATLTLVLSYLAVSVFLFPDSFKPVSLDPGEERRLERKLHNMGVGMDGRKSAGKEQRLEPEPYSETDARRVVQFTEREINGLLARNTDLARKLAIDLSADLASAKLLLPLDPEMPLFGGRTLKVTAGLELAMEQGRPRAILKGVSVWGVPLPNAWLGNLKNVDLVAQYGGNGGFWSAVTQGIEEIKVIEGNLMIKLKE